MGHRPSALPEAERRVGFPNINTFPKSHPGPYERQMGVYLVSLLRVFAGRLPDRESHTSVAELAADPSRWSAGHAMFDAVRGRLLKATERGDSIRCAQYTFEESCCQAMYNGTGPSDPFDPSSAFFVVAQALGLARLVGIPLDAVATVFDGPIRE
jgi:hypothetical protein